MDRLPVRPRNDPAQYDDLVEAWWEADGPFAMLHWLAVARAGLVPPAPRPGALLVDVACGGGLMAPHVRALGYRHLGVDIGAGATTTARAQGVEALRGDAVRLPVRDAVADVVLAGEVLEHVHDHDAVVAEVCRVLRPGGTVVVDTIAATAVGRFLSVTLMERLPGGPPPRLHDPDLFVDRHRLLAAFARHGVALRLRGLRPSLPQYAAWVAGRRPDVRLVPTRSTAALFQGVGVKTPTLDGEERP